MMLLQIVTCLSASRFLKVKVNKQNSINSATDLTVYMQIVIPLYDQYKNYRDILHYVFTLRPQKRVFDT